MSKNPRREPRTTGNREDILPRDDAPPYRPSPFRMPSVQDRRNALRRYIADLWFRWRFPLSNCLMGHFLMIDLSSSPIRYLVCTSDRRAPTWSVFTHFDDPHSIIPKPALIRISTLRLISEPLCLLVLIPFPFSNNRNSLLRTFNPFIQTP